MESNRDYFVGKIDGVQVDVFEMLKNVTTLYVPPKAISKKYDSLEDALVDAILKA